MVLIAFRLVQKQMKFPGKLKVACVLRGGDRTNIVLNVTHFVLRLTFEKSQIGSPARFVVSYEYIVEREPIRQVISFVFGRCPGIVAGSIR